MASKTTGNYRRILNLLNNWPVDETKAGRDLGIFLKNSIRKLQKSEKLEENQQYWDRQYLSLQKIINSNHQKKYPRILSSSATGLTAEQYMTFGAGGHSQKILESSHNIKLLALDRDPLAYSCMEHLTKNYPEQVTPLLEDFHYLKMVLLI
ncbi:hypothetical protein Trydic_g15566 [Trypoxylus dichotomus]